MQKDKQGSTGLSSNQKKVWEAPALSYVGDVEDVVQGGEGKVSTMAADPGEPKKTRPAESG